MYEYGAYVNGYAPATKISTQNRTITHTETGDTFVTHTNNSTATTSHSKIDSSTYAITHMSTTTTTCDTMSTITTIVMIITLTAASDGAAHSTLHDPTTSPITNTPTMDAIKTNNTDMNQ